MRRVAYMMVLALAAPLTGSAQGPVAAQGPAERLLAHRAELSLTAAQVQKLEAIDRKYDQQNQEVVAKLAALRGKSVGEPVRMRDMAAADQQKLQANRTQMQPLMEQLRGSHLAATAELRGVLTADQSARADAYLYQGAGQGQGRGAGAGRATMSGRNHAPGSGRGMMRQGQGQGARGRGGRGGR